MTPMATKKSPMYPRKSPMYPQKSLAYSQKIPMYLQKSPRMQTTATSREHDSMNDDDDEEEEHDMSMSKPTRQKSPAYLQKSHTYSHELASVKDIDGKEDEEDQEAPSDLDKEDDGHDSKYGSSSEFSSFNGFNHDNSSEHHTSGDDTPGGKGQKWQVDVHKNDDGLTHCRPSKQRMCRKFKCLHCMPHRFFSTLQVRLCALSFFVVAFFLSRERTRSLVCSLFLFLFLFLSLSVSLSISSHQISCCSDYM